MREVQKIEMMLNGEEIDDGILDDKSSVYEGGFSEKFAKNKK